MELFQQGLMLLLHWQNFVWMNIGLVIGIVFGAIPGLTVILAIVLFLPFTYSLGAVESFMFLLGIYCAGGYGGSISAILIHTPGTPHAAATMLDGYPMAQRGEARKAMTIALDASTVGGLLSAFSLLFFAPQVAKLAERVGTPEYFLVCLFGLTIIAGVSGKSLIKGLIACFFGLFIETIGIDPMTGGTRFIFGNINLYSGFDLVICLIGLFALGEVLSKSKIGSGKTISNGVPNDNGTISLQEYKRMGLPVILSAIIGIIIGIIPGTGASMASFFSYNIAKNISHHPEEFGHGSIEAISAAETANNAVTGATLIPLLTLGIPGDGCVAIMMGALMINGLTPGPKLFQDHGPVMYAIMLGLVLVNIFMFVQGRLLTKVFVKVINIPVSILTPIIVIFCFAGAFSVNSSTFDIGTTLVFAAIAYILGKLDFPTIPILLGLVLGQLTEENFRRSLILSDGSWKIFVSSPVCIIFIGLILVALTLVFATKIKDMQREKN